MHTVTRNGKSNKKGKHLLTFVEGKLALSLKSAKALCGYSDGASNKIILDKVTSPNIITEVSFTKMGTIVETYCITLNGFRELVCSIVQKDKIQNATLALEMMIEAEDEIKTYRNEISIPLSCPGLKTMTNDDIVIEIRDLVDTHGFSKSNWIKLYKEFDIAKGMHTKDSIISYATRKSGGYLTLKYGVLDYITREMPDDIPLLHDAALKLFNN